MAKSKDFKANPNAKPLPAVSAFIQNKDLLLRLSFMHQAASYLHHSQAAADLSFPGLTISTSAKRERLQPTKQGNTGKKKTGGRNRRKARTEDGRHGSLDRLARGIGRGIKEISVHNKAKLYVSTASSTRSPPSSLADLLDSYLLRPFFIGTGITQRSLFQAVHLSSLLDGPYSRSQLWAQSQTYVYALLAQSSAESYVLFGCLLI